MKAVSAAPDPGLAVVAGGRVDWAYAARVEAPSSSPEDALGWARAAFEGAPLPMRVFLVVGWTGLLLEGGPRSDATRVLGWPVVQAAPDTAVLQRRSLLGIRATLVFTTGPSSVTFSSAMTFNHALGRSVWTVVAPVHRWAVRSVLGSAATSRAGGA